jgi:hypothetical protein
MYFRNTCYSAHQKYKSSLNYTSFEEQIISDYKKAPAELNLKLVAASCIMWLIFYASFTTQTCAALRYAGSVSNESNT